MAGVKKHSLETITKMKNANNPFWFKKGNIPIAPFSKGHIPWHKGLTKENCELARKASDRLKSDNSYGFQKGYTPALKGQTKETSASVASMTKKLKEQYIGGRKPIIKSKRYHDEKLDITFRSSWELKFAQYLSAIDISWEYEQYNFLLSIGEVYIPDFYLPTADLFVEIKGSFRGVFDIHKPNLFEKEYGKNVFIIDNAIYHSLEEVMNGQTVTSANR